ncbi:MAG: SET domain-containing protein-lysine N-methyltransferase [Chlamydiales bacterium]|nr:SET domain-containing protein-lysine N-methyltransferase [Chlamydiales bacterium]
MNGCSNVNGGNGVSGSWPQVVTQEVRALLTNIQQVWSNDEVKARTPSDFHSLLALVLDPNNTREFRLEGIASRIKGESDLALTCLEVPECNRFNINAVMIAIFQKNLAELKVYLDSGIDPNWSDNLGYSLMHYAAMLPTPEMPRVLQLAGGNVHAANFVGATPVDFLQAQTKDRSDFVFYPWKTGPCVNRHYYNLAFKTDYSRRARFMPDGLLEIRMHGSQEITTIDEWWKSELTRQYEKLMSHPDPLVPNIYVTLVEQADDGSAVPAELQNQYDVRAREPIAAGQVITEYSGVVDHICKNPKGLKTGSIGGLSFGLTAVDAEKEGNFAPYINHGAPNCTFVTIMSKGLPRHLVVALRKIEADERLLLDYGSAYFKSLKYEPIELAPNAIKDYLEFTNNLSYISVGQIGGGDKFLPVAISSEGSGSLEPVPRPFYEAHMEYEYHRCMLRYLVRGASGTKDLLLTLGVPEDRIEMARHFLDGPHCLL